VGDVGRELVDAGEGVGGRGRGVERVGVVLKVLHLGEGDVEHAGGDEHPLALGGGGGGGDGGVELLLGLLQLARGELEGHEGVGLGLGVGLDFHQGGDGACDDGVGCGGGRERGGDGGGAAGGGGGLALGERGFGNLLRDKRPNEVEEIEDRRACQLGERHRGGHGGGGGMRTVFL